VVEAVGDQGCPPTARQVAPPPVLPGQPPARQWAPRDDAHPVLLAGRQHCRLDGPGEDRIRRLLAPEAFAAATLRRPLGLDDQLGRIRRAADDADLALVD